MGWAVIIVLAAATLLGLWRWAKPDRGALQFLGAALLLALAGYAWQGRPGLEGRPKPPPERQEMPESDFAATRESMLGRFDRAASWLTIAESYQRRGNTESAAKLLRSAIRQDPDNPDLWVGYGNALVIHADGLMTPAAQLAFQRAARLAPEHPAPRFFYGLALAQGGDYDQAERIWQDILATAPADASWRSMIQERLQMLRQARAMGQLPGPQPQ